MSLPPPAPLSPVPPTAVLAVGEREVRRSGSASAAEIARQAWLRETVLAHQAALVRYATGLALGQAELARDAVQDTFLRLCKEERSAIEGHLVPWLYAVCRSRVYDRLRKDKPARPLDEVGLATTPDATPSPRAQHEASEQAQRLLALLDSLTPNQREVVRLRFQAGLSYQEIADVTGLTSGNVGFLLHTALKLLRTKLESAPEP